MDSWTAVDEEEAPLMSEHQLRFDALMDKYDDGIEPLENWAEHDLVLLAAIADAELQSREKPALT